MGGPCSVFVQPVTLGHIAGGLLGATVIANETGERCS